MIHRLCCDILIILCLPDTVNTEVATMALADVCGFKPGKASFGSNLEQDNEECCGNFSANSTLSLPPFANPGTNLGR